VSNINNLPAFMIASLPNVRIMERYLEADGTLYPLEKDLTNEYTKLKDLPAWGEAIHNASLLLVSGLTADDATVNSDE
jgi:hypothetical protein